MWTRIVLLTLISVVVVGCDLLPQKAMPPAPPPPPRPDVTTMSSTALCTEYGTEAAAAIDGPKDETRYGQIRSELARRDLLDAIKSDEAMRCIQLATNIIDAYYAMRMQELNAARMQQAPIVIYQPPKPQPLPVPQNTDRTCTSYTEGQTTTTTCH